MLCFLGIVIKRLDHYACVGNEKNKEHQKSPIFFRNFSFEENVNFYRCNLQKNFLIWIKIEKYLNEKGRGANSILTKLLGSKVCVNLQKQAKKEVALHAQEKKMKSIFHLKASVHLCIVARNQVNPFIPKWISNCKKIMKIGGNTSKD